MAIISKIRNQAGLIIALIGISLLAFILGDLLKSNGSFLSSGNNVAVIDGEKITYQEFEREVQEAINNYKQSTGQENIDQNTTDMIREQAWSQLLRRKVMDKEFDKMNITVGTKELVDMVQGNDPHPTVKQSFTDPKTGQFDPNNVIRFLNNLDKDPQMKERWVAFEKAIQLERISQKYNNLVKQAMYATQLQAKKEYIDRNRSAKIRYVLMPYTAIPDTEVQVTESEISQYYKEHQFEHKQEASRKIEYVAFDLVPTEQDRQEALEDITKLKPAFAEAKDDSSFVRLNSDENNPDFSFHKKGTLSIFIDSAMFNSPVGTVIGPYFENNTYKLSKLMHVEMMPDSVKARHILLKAKEGETEEKLKARADSLKQLIKSGAKKFDELAQAVSEDPGSGSKGGDLGWFREGMMVKPFNDAAFQGKKGDMPIVVSQFGVHLIEITDKGAPVKKVQVGTVTRKLEPSSKTTRAIFAKANEFAGKNRTGEAFDKTVVEQNLNKRIAEVKETDRMVPGLENPREMIRWAYKADKGDVAPKVFDMGDKYVVAKLAEIKEKGFAPLEQVRDEMVAGAKKDKKAEKLIEKMNNLEKGVSQIEALGSKINYAPQVAENVTFAISVIPGVGREPEVLGRLFGMKQGVLSQPIKGNTGVYVVVVDSFTEPQPVNDYKDVQNQIVNNLKNRADYELFNALKDKANVEDNRGKFY